MGAHVHEYYVTLLTLTLKSWILIMVRYDIPEVNL